MAKLKVIAGVKTPKTGRLARMKLEPAVVKPTKVPQVNLISVRKHK